MDALTHVLAQAPAPTSDGGTLLGVAAILTAIGTILGVARLYLKKKPDDDDDLDAAAREHVRILKDTISDLEGSLERCRSEKQLMTAESRLKDMHIGELEALLADKKRELREHDERARRDR